MEIALAPSMPIYASGLGIPAGDMLRLPVDLGFPMIAVPLLYRQGYFRQGLNEVGSQRELADSWTPQENSKRRSR